MMLYPAVDLLKEKVDSKYTLSIMAAKRARDIIDGKPKLTLSENDNPLSVATVEISQDLISYKRDFATEEAAEEECAGCEEAPACEDAPAECEEAVEE